MRKKIKIADSHFVPIVGDGAIAITDAAEGRSIPVLILNCENHRELLNLIYLHENSPPGDVMCTWGANKRYAFLLLDFSRPSKVKVGLKFNLESQGGLADGIVQSQGVYIQPSESGQRVSEGLDNPKILIEVSPKTKLSDWDERLLTAIGDRLKRNGMPRKQATVVAKEFLNRTREIWGLRMHNA